MAQILPKLFLSVGAMKAGTTFLYNALDQHPEIYFTPEKELHYFAHVNDMDNNLMKPLIPSPAQGVMSVFKKKKNILSLEHRRKRLSAVMRGRYSRLKDVDRLREIVIWYTDRYMTDPIDDNWLSSVFEVAGDRFCSDFSNLNAQLSERGWQHVRQTCNQLRVIYILRHPVERMWSQIKFSYKQQGKLDVLETISLSELKRNLKNGRLSCHGRYSDVISHLRKILAPEQFKIIIFEDLIDRFPESMCEIEEFLGISKHIYDHVEPTRKANATPDIPLGQENYDRILRAVKPQLIGLRDQGVAFPESYWH